MTLTQTTVNQILDDRGLLDDAHGKGTYALRVETPNDVESVARAFLSVSDATPLDGFMERLTADRVAYVGASIDVYSRLMDHADGQVRKATFLQAFDAVDVIDVWPTERGKDPFEQEYNRASELSRQGWVAYTDGLIL